MVGRKRVWLIRLGRPMLRLSREGRPAGPLSLPRACRRQSRGRGSCRSRGGDGVVTEGRSGLHASGGKGSAKHAGDAGLMTAWYSRRCHLPPWGVAGRSVWRLWRHRKVPDVPRRKRAAERSTRRKGTGRHVAVAREGGRILERPLRCGARTPRGPDDFVGRAEGDRPWREVSRVDRGEIRCRAP